MMRLTVFLGFLFMVAGTGGAGAQVEEGSVEWLLRQCATIENDERRHQCYDNILRPGEAGRRSERPAPPAQTGPAPSPAERAAPPPERQAPERAAPAQDHREDFGLENERRAEERKKQRESGKDEIAVVITEIKKRPRGEGVFVTRDGQVWWQIDGTLEFPPETPFDATIKKGFFGSFRLAPEGTNRRYRVRRQE